MDERCINFRIPGTVDHLVYERTEEGRLLRITGGGRVYYDASEETRIVFDSGFVTALQTELPGGLLRTMHALGRTWVESFAWDAKGLLTEIDGVKVGYDDQQRIVSCHGAGGDWFYAYSGPYLTVIDTPHGLRQITRADDGRPLSVRTKTRTTEIVYDAGGTRLPSSATVRNWNRDASGRLWTITDNDGNVLLTYVWDRYHCLGCIAGSVGQPLAMVYSLDLTGTPITVISRDSVRRIPRDAFGESLLHERNVPGLFCGAVSDGLVYLPFRRLDPFTGSFDAPDPMHGEASDPRRAAGYTGPLAVELPASGPYTVCRNNPMTLADPTGAISDYWWLIPSSLTWSLQNTIGSLLGMWLNLEMSPLGMIASAAAIAATTPQGGVFDIEGISANNYDSFAIRSDGWLARLQSTAGQPTTRTWTYQFLVNAPGVNFTNLEHARVFAPNSRFQPRLYGTVLHCDPQDNAPFIMRGQRTPPNGANLLNWSRNGGTSEAVIPGSFVPAFPSGGFHLNAVQRGVLQQAGTLVELEPSGAVLNGTIAQRALLTLNGTGFGLAVNGLVLLSSLTAVVEVARVLDAEEENGKTLVRVDTAGAGLGTSGIRLEGLSALVGTENLTPVAGVAQRLNLAGSSNDYRPNSTVVRMNRGGAVVGADKVTGLEAQLSIDEALPSSLGNSLRIRPAVAAGNFNGTLTGNANVLRIDTGTVPGPGTGVVVGPAANAIATIVQSVNGQEITVDRALTPLGGNGTAVNWQSLAPLPAVGRRSGTPENQQQITYTPDRAGTAPSSGFVWVEGSGIATRRIVALTYDAIILSQALPDANPAAFSVDRFTLQAPDVSGISLTTAQVLALNAAPPAGAQAFNVIELTGAAVAAGANIVGGATLTGDTAQVTIDPNSAPGNLLPGQIVVLQSGANVEAAAVLRLRLTITLSRNLTLNASGLEAVLLGPTGPTYTGLRRGDRTFRVLPSVPAVLVGGAPVTSDFPRFAIGELVRVVLTSSFTFTPAVGLVFALQDTVSVVISNAAGNNINYTFEINDGVAPLITVTNTTNAAAAPAGTIGIAVVSDPATQTPQQTIAAIVAAMLANAFLVTTNADGGFEVNSPSPIVGTPSVNGTAQNELVVALSERLYRVQFVNGTTITGADDEAVIPPSVTNLTVTRLDVQDPTTGSSRLGIDGESLPSSQVRFSVWTPNAFDFWTGGSFNFNNNRLGIVDGQNVFAVRPGSGNQTLDIQFLSTPGLAAPLTLTLPAQAAPPAGTAAGSGFSASFTLDGASLIFLDTPLTSPLTGLILAVPYIGTTRRVDGNLNSGKVRVPEDHENVSKELDRRQALEDHELTHTHQSARLGPWLFAYFPLWIIEMITDLASTAGMPEFGRYVPATVGTDSITIPAVSGVTINADDYVQVAQSGRAEIVKLGAKNGDVYSLNQQMMQKLAAKNIAAGAAQARREESGAVEIGEWIVNIMQFTTVGGLMNQIAVLGWGGVIWLITMFIQWIRGMARSSVTAQLAADHITITLPANGRVEGAAAGSLLALQSGNQTFVRPVQSITGQTIVLATAVPLQGEVRISSYSTSSALFPNWHDYFPATFPDRNRAASLQVQRVGTQTLTLAVHDRVHIRSSGGHSFNTVVTFVGDNGLIEVEDATLVSGNETEEYFIAKIGEDDPMGFSDQFLLNQMHLGWMQYIHDPWGQIVYRAKPTSLAGKIFARSARYLFGTQGWSVLPAFGYFWYDNAFQQANAQRSHMEQEASHRSGDTYCPIGSLHGSIAVVGDVARYWLTEDGAIRDTNTPQDMIALTSQDAPGSNAQQFIAVTPTVTGGLPAGMFVSDVFSQVNANLGLTGVSDRGWMPVNSTLERTSGAFVAFTRPGSHTITGQTISNLPASLDAETNGFPEIITFTRNVGDVGVTLSNLPVTDTSGTPFDLIPFQRALFAVTPNGNRVYRATLLESGAIATVQNNLEIVMQGIAPAAAPGGLATENVEISRFHQFDAASGTFNSGLPVVNIPADIDVAVRRLQIRLVDTVPLRATDNPADPAINSLLPGGTGVLLIPAPFSIAAITTGVTGTPTLTPDFSAPANVPANTQAFVRDGGVVNMLIRANDPPEAVATLTITIPVGPAGSTTVPVTCQITVNPHFTLDSTTGGFNLTAGTPLTLRSSDGRNITLVGALAGIDVATNNEQITLTLTTASPGPVVVLVADAANGQIMARRTITVA
ncbi:MAG TPA: hypothetical protein VFZ22_23405 [Pyrinomonadaceae bacterium]|nr:hypothetical protein [Pyrinomonadaceae bacterium]